MKNKTTPIAWGRGQAENQRSTLPASPLAQPLEVVLFLSLPFRAEYPFSRRPLNGRFKILTNTADEEFDLMANDFSWLGDPLSAVDGVSTAGFSVALVECAVAFAEVSATTVVDGVPLFTTGCEVVLLLLECLALTAELFVELEPDLDTTFASVPFTIIVTFTELLGSCCPLDTLRADSFVSLARISTTICNRQTVL